MNHPIAAYGHPCTKQMAAKQSQLPESTDSLFLVTRMFANHIVKKYLQQECGLRVCAVFVLQDYIAVKEKNAKYLPHSAGRYAAKRFRKAQCPIVERLTNSLMMHGRNNGKKLMAVRIVKHAFEIIHLLTGEVSTLSVY